MRRSSGTQFIFSYWKPAAILLLLTPIFTELLSNNIPVTRFFQPKLLLILITLVYGPVLLLRELAVRWHLRLAGYVALGLVYGIYNEGLLGKTFFQIQIANTPFTHYGFMWGINLPWAVVITVFHAFYAFLFPLLMVYNIFPRLAFRPWISTRWWIGISIVTFLYVSYKFLKNTWPVSPVHYAVLIVIIISLITLSKYFKGGLTTNDKHQRLWLLGGYGVVFVATTFTVTHLIAHYRASTFFFFAYTLMNLLLAVKLLDKKYGIRGLLFFALWAELGFTASVILVAVVSKSRVGIITSSTFALVFAAILAVIFLRNKANPINND